MALTQIQSEMIADAAVTTAKIADANITTAKVADANITPAKLSQPLTQGTLQASTSGTSITFTGIPSWVKRITVMFNGVSTSGTSVVQVQIGTSGGVQTSGYTGVTATTGNGVTGSAAMSAGFTTDAGTLSAAYIRHGALTLFLVDSATGTWAASGVISIPAALYSMNTGGTKVLSGTLDRVRITTVNGTDTFDAGSINILYE